MYTDPVFINLHSHCAGIIITHPFTVSYAPYHTFPPAWQATTIYGRNTCQMTFLIFSKPIYGIVIVGAKGIVGAIKDDYNDLV